MKKALLAILLAAMCGAGVAGPVRAESPAVTTLQIEGIKPGSAANVEALLKALPGVTQVKVSEELGIAVVIYNPAQSQVDDFTAAMKEAGHLATQAKADFQCTHCPATYAQDGTCIVCGGELEPVAKG